jgi:hypothetical protein
VVLPPEVIPLWSDFFARATFGKRFGYVFNLGLFLWLLTRKNHQADVPV